MKMRTSNIALPQPMTLPGMAGQGVTNNYVRDEPLPYRLGGDELAVVRRELTDFFGKYLFWGGNGSGFPRWSEDPRALIEVAWYLARWHAYVLPGQGRWLTFKEIASLLCRSLHVDMPANIYDVVARRRRRGHSVIDYLAKVRREARVSYDTLCLEWHPQLQFPMLRGADYKYYFD